MIYRRIERHINNEHIKSDIAVTILSILQQKTFSRFDNFFLLYTAEHVFHRFECRSGQGFYFGKNQSSVFFGDKIDFAPACAPIAAYNNVSLFF